MAVVRRNSAGLRCRRRVRGGWHRTRERGARLARTSCAGPIRCADASEESCSAVHFYRVGPQAVEESGVPLSVPSPCRSHSLQIASPEGRDAGLLPEPSRLDYAVCTTVAGRTLLTLFQVDSARAYAAAERVLAGCVPLGAGVFAGSASFAASCGEKRQLAIPMLDAPPRIVDLDVRGVLCEGDSARLRLGPDWLRLEHPIGDLELLLDSELAAPGSRAVWTGGALLVARSEGGRPRLSRFGCKDSRLEALADPLSHW
jgi:hypothetical protein